MQYGFILPHGDIHTLAELAHDAEVAGWDGVFYWDGIYIKEAGPMYDPWIVLAAMAMHTERVRLGLVLTPPSRRRPWKLARETVTGLWSGKPYSFHGKHYHVEEMTFLPPPVQSPRIPIWVVGAWPSKKSMQRVLRYDGLLPTKIAGGDAPAAITAGDIRAMKAYIDEHRSQTT